MTSNAINETLAEAGLDPAAVDFDFGEPAHLEQAVEDLDNSDHHHSLEVALELLNEHTRQIYTKGCTPELDDRYIYGELERAASAYSFAAAGSPAGARATFWPWRPELFKIGSGRRMLVKAGGVIIAAIKRIDRASGRRVASVAGLSIDVPTALLSNHMRVDVETIDGRQYVALLNEADEVIGAGVLSNFHPRPIRPSIHSRERDLGGRLVRQAWVRWAASQADPKPSWLVSYDDLDESDKEADRQIAEALWAAQDNYIAELEAKLERIDRGHA